MKIESITTRDFRKTLPKGAGSDAIHRDPVYSYAVTELRTDTGTTGTGLAFTIGAGNDLVCAAAGFLAQGLVGREIEELMASFGAWQLAASNEQQFRWLGPHKGVVHLALASVTNACWDLWARARGVPLWKLLVELSSDELLATLDLSYLEDELSIDTARRLLDKGKASSSYRMGILDSGYPGYDTSIGWFNYSNEQLKNNVHASMRQGFTAIKLKVGSSDIDRDVERARIVREVAGEEAILLVDANQQWSIAQAIEFCKEASGLDIYWLEEPTHPDDILGHGTIANSIKPVKVAAGEHVPNRVCFKNYLQSGCMHICQVDALRVAGVSEFLVVSLLAKKFGVPVIPHVGDMGQLHQHLVLFNHIAIDHEATFLEYIPHLSESFVEPAVVKKGIYQIPKAAGSGCALKAGWDKAL